jgi:hypothetical protein
MSSLTNSFHTTGVNTLGSRASAGIVEASIEGGTGCPAKPALLLRDLRICRLVSTHDARHWGVMDQPLHSESRVRSDCSPFYVHP